MPSQSSRESKIRRRYRELGPRRFARWFLIKRIGKPVVRAADRFMGRQSKVGNPEVFDPELFPCVAAIEGQWKEICAELDALLEHRDRLPTINDIQPDQGKINRDRRWKTFWFAGLGHRSERSRALCPATARALDAVPGLETAFFSLLGPRIHVPRHAGLTKGLIRCHLALRVPRDAERVRMRIGETTFHWQEGRAVVFDDTYKHEVWNDTDEERAVLLFDFRRPMGWRGRAVYRAMRAILKASPYVRDSRRNQREWERGDGAALGPGPVEA